MVESTHAEAIAASLAACAYSLTTVTGDPGPATALGAEFLAIDQRWLVVFDARGSMDPDRLRAWSISLAYAVLGWGGWLFTTDVHGVVTPAPTIAPLVPVGWRDEPRHVVVLKSAPRGRVDYPIHGPGLRSVRVFDDKLALMLANLDTQQERRRVVDALAPVWRSDFEALYTRARTVFIDSLMGAFDEQDQAGVAKGRVLAAARRSALANFDVADWWQTLVNRPRKAAGSPINTPAMPDTYLREPEFEEFFFTDEARRRFWVAQHAATTK